MSVGNSRTEDEHDIHGSWEGASSILNCSVKMNLFGLRTSNIERPTPNVELENRESFDVERSMLNVGGSSSNGSWEEPISNELDMH